MQLPHASHHFNSLLISNESYHYLLYIISDSNNVFGLVYCCYVFIKIKMRLCFFFGADVCSSFLQENFQIKWSRACRITMVLIEIGVYLFRLLFFIVWFKVHMCTLRYFYVDVIDICSVAESLPATCTS